MKNSYQWIVDVVVDLPEDADAEAFFNALEDQVIDFTEKWDGQIGGTFYFGEPTDGKEEET